MSESRGAIGQAELLLSWDMGNLDIKTKTVERTLEPLVLQVTTLVSSKSPQKKKGKSKKAHALVAAVALATQNFVEKGELIAEENPEIKVDMLRAVEEVRGAGDLMTATAKAFAAEPCSSGRRGDMVCASRTLLSAVTRLLILADMIDVHMLLKKLHRVEDDLAFLKTVSSQAELLEGMDRFGRSAAELMAQAARRQQELKNPSHRDAFASARAVLKRHSLMLLTASKTYVRHPELSAAKANRDYVLNKVGEAVASISEVAQGRCQPSGGGEDGEEGGELALKIRDLEVALADNAPQNASSLQSLEEQLEAVIAGAALLADSPCARDERRERIVKECAAVREAMQSLMDLCLADSHGHGVQVGPVQGGTRALGKQLRRAAGDAVSDAFLNTPNMLEALVEAAKAGSEREVALLGPEFAASCRRVVEAAMVACSVSARGEAVRMVRCAAAQLEGLCPQVIKAAEVLANRSRSKVAAENMEVFRSAWEAQLSLLTDAVDDLVTMEDFLAVSEAHILQDVNSCCLALREKEAREVATVGAVIVARGGRLCRAVGLEMQDFQPGDYRDGVENSLARLNIILPHFGARVSEAVAALGSGDSVEENEFIDTSRLVYDGVREVRQAVLLNRGEITDTSDDEEEDERSEEGDYPRDELEESVVESRCESVVDEYPEIQGICNAREAMEKLPEEEKEKILQQVEVFRVEKRAFDREVSKWDDQGNEVILLAKNMCTIMMDMTDFTRGTGALKTTTDVINAAKKISSAGTRLDKLARKIADQCPESSTKQDLLAYLQRIALYCHQLNITSKVKADVQSVSGELVVSGLDSATSLIQAAKNLMNAVVLTVKASYVASTKYRKTGEQATSAPVVVWRMKAPEKLPLVRREPEEEVRAKVRRASGPRIASPLQMLSSFEDPTQPQF